MTTRQQEGDEAMVKAVYPCAYEAITGSIWSGPLDGDWRNNRYIGISWDDATSNISATVQPEDETTLPALDAKCACGGSIEAIRSVHSYDECVNMDCYAPRIQMEAVLQALEAERDALKAENHTLRNSESWDESKLKSRVKDLESNLAAMTEDRNLWQDAHNEDCPNLAEVERLKDERDTYRKACDLNIRGSSDLYAMMLAERFELEAKIVALRAQLDAVVGQETPREIWERGYRLGRFIARTEGAVKSDSVPPYTPPLKAGQ